jgi:hypothetical protein
MKLLIVLICCLGDVTPVPGAAGVLESAIDPEPFWNPSSLSLKSNVMLASSAGRSSRRPMSWSMNWPHAQPHCEMSFSEKRFWPASLKTRLLTDRGDGPADHAADPVGVVRRGNARVLRAGPAPLGLRDVVAGAVERANGEEICADRARHGEREQEEQDRRQREAVHEDLLPGRRGLLHVR